MSSILGWIDGLFGGSSTGDKTQSSITSVNNIINQAITTNIQNCITNNSGSQSLTINGVNNCNISDISQLQTMTINASCVTQQSVLNSMQTSVINALQNAAATNSQDILSLFKNAGTDVNTAISNNVSNVFSATNMQTIMTNLSNSQSLTISNCNGTTIQTISQQQLANALSTTISAQIVQNAGVHNG